MDLKGKVIIVTGSSRGVGKGIAKVLARCGATVVVTARTEIEQSYPGTIHQTAQEIEQEGGTAFPIRMDLSRDDDIKRMVGTVLEQYRRIDVLVNNAVAVGRARPFMDMDMDNWDYTWAVNVRGPILACRLAIAPMIAQGGGIIVNVTSGAASMESGSGSGVPITYGTTKAALDRFTVGLHQELAAQHIVAIILSPGFTYTERMGQRAKALGMNLQDAEPTDYPARALEYILTHNPESYAGQYVSVPEFIAKHKLGDPARQGGAR